MNAVSSRWVFVVVVFLCAPVSVLAQGGENVPKFLMVSSFFNDGVIRYDAVTGEFVEPLEFTPLLDGPEGIALGPDGNFYVVSRRNNSVLRYAGHSGKFLGVFVPSGSGGLELPHGMVFGPDGNLYVASNGTQEVIRYDRATGEFIDVFASIDAFAAIALIFGPDRNLYVATSTGNSVHRFNGLTGNFIDEFVKSGSGGLNWAAGLGFGPDGNLYVNSLLTDMVLRFDGGTGEFIDVFVSEGSGGLDGPSIGLTFGPDGNLYVGSGRTDQVLRYDGQTGEFIDVFASQFLNHPTGMIFVEEIPVPAASDWGLAVLTLLVLTTGTLLIRLRAPGSPRLH